MNLQAYEQSLFALDDSAGLFIINTQFSQITKILIFYVTSHNILGNEQLLCNALCLFKLLLLFEGNH